MSLDLLIITALQEEFETIHSFLPIENKIHSQHCDLVYYVGSIELKSGELYSYGLMCLSHMGNTTAGVSTTHAIRDLDPKCIFMFGLAAAVKGRANLSDVIVATRIFYYELAKLYPDVAEIRPQSYQTDPLLNNRLRSFSSSFKPDYKVKFGPFAAGEKVVADNKTVKKLLVSEPKLLGVEMESYGVAEAAAKAFHRPRFAAVRGVSDFANPEKDDTWRNQALRNAAEFLVAFLKAGVIPREKARLTKLEIAQTLIAIHHLSLNQRASIEHSIKTSIPDYQGFDVQELLIDQTDLYVNGSLTNPTEALSRQNDLIQRLIDFRDDYPQAHIAYFGLAHIPLMFYAGYCINRRVVQVFATDRQTNEWMPLSKTGVWPKLQVQEMPTHPSSNAGDVIIKVSISHLVRPEQVQEFVERPLAIFHLSLTEPRPDMVTGKEQLRTYSRIFHRLLGDVNALFPNTQRIHLFMAVPPTVAFRFGQQISKTTDPDILVYNFSNKDQPNYGWAINVMTGEVIDHRI